MKKTMSFFLSLVIVFSMIFYGNAIASAPAEGVKNLDKAYVLRDLGVFLGSNMGFELDRKPSRIEGAVLLVKLLGKQEEAMNLAKNHPFSDVPSWGDPYVTYLYTMGITAGTGGGMYGSNIDLEPYEYITFILRALGYSDKDGDFIWNESIQKALEIGLLFENEALELENTHNFIRDDVVNISFNALTTKFKQSNKTLIKKLVDEDNAIELYKAIESGLYDIKPSAVIESSVNVEHSLIIKADGTLWAWGNNNYGQLGDGMQVDRSEPIQIGHDNDWYKVSAGYEFSLGLKRNGTLWVWGRDDYYNPDNKILSPVKVDESSDWEKISAGQSYTVALKKDGTLWESGRFNTHKNNLLEFKQIGLDKDWEDISTKSSHTLALKKDGTIWSWGMGSNGQLGNGATTTALTPQKIGNENDWKKVSAGYSYSIAQKKDGSLWRWGYGTDNISISIPAKVGNETDWVSFSTYSFTTAIKADGSLWTWGYHNGKASVYEKTNMVNTPPTRIGLDNDWRATNEFLAVKNDGSLWAWGYGVGELFSKNNPVCISTDNDWNQVSAGYYHSLAIKSNGSLWAWGSNSFRQCGCPWGRFVERPMQIGVDYNWAKVLSSGNSSFALKSNGTLWGWGHNNNKMGEIKNEYISSPTRIGNDEDWVDITSTGSIIFGLKEDGTLWMWGTDTNREFFNRSYGDSWSSQVPVKVGDECDWVKISGGGNFSGSYFAGLKKDGSLWVWPFYFSNHEIEKYRDEPNFIKIGNDSDWKNVFGGSVNLIAQKNNGSLWQWVHTDNFGFNRSNELELINEDKDWNQVSTLQFHILLLKNDGTLFSYGYNIKGQLGDGTKIDRTTPVKVEGGLEWKYASAGLIYSLAINSDGTLWGWGHNDSYQLGLENPVFKTEPVIVLEAD